MDFIEQILEKRLAVIQKVTAAFLFYVNPDNICQSKLKRGPLQMKILERAGLQKIGPNKSIVNGVAERYGYESVRILGTRYWVIDTRQRRCHNR
jgi:hypothetical protein